MRPEAVVSSPALDPAKELLHQGEELGIESKISSHVLMEATDRERTGLEILHQDLFDPAAPVVLSALSVLGRLRDPRSLKFVARLLTSQEETIQSAAVQAWGALGHPGSSHVLFDFLKIAKSERVRCAILEALAALAPQDPAVLALIRDNSSAQLASAESRACAAALLARLEGAPAAERLLESNKGEIIEAVYAAAQGSEALIAAVLHHGASNYHRLSTGNRQRLVTLAGAYTLPGSGRLLVQGLEDVDPDVRRTAYQALGQSPAQVEHYPEILAALSERVDPVLSLEEEALAGIEHMESLLGESHVPVPAVCQRIYTQVQDLFKTLSARGRQVTSDGHELGWLISRSRDYLEFYADEEFRQTLLNYLKGGACFTPDRLLAMLKATAVKVEVRHFDGYKALADVIRNPKLPGIGLVARELAIVRLGKRETLYRLIRNLRLTRLLITPREADSLFWQIYTWAKEAKLYRLAEAAMQALIRVNPGKAAEACEECLRPPVFSKLCAIAAIRLLKELDWERMEPTLLRLITSAGDTYILLNLIDALSSQRFPLGGELVQALVTLMRSGRDQEVLNRVAVVLGSQNDASTLASITESFERTEPWRQGLVLAVIERRVTERRVDNREGLSEFLYKTLRSGSECLQARAAVLLWKLGDDYALKVLRGFFLTFDLERRTTMLRALLDSVSAPLVPVLQPLLRQENAGLQEALRATLLSAKEEGARGRIREAVLALRGARSAAAEAPEETDTELQVDFDHEKKAFRFEREHVQELAILFTDIQGYSRKAQALSTMQLAALLQDYEGILLPTVSAHRGELIKKMGDGHMFVFQRPLDATLAAIRLQKALKRFNSYREEELRLVVRVGLHWGKVMCKEGDVLGNHVNIASRLESSAKGGSVLISNAVYQLLEGQVHAREIGFIEVKNISEPIKVYEPYEIMIDLPDELDPLKSSAATTVPKEPSNGNDGKRASILDRSTLEYLAETFTSLHQLCQKAERGQVPVAAISRELAGRWQKLRGILGGSKVK